MRRDQAAIEELADPSIRLLYEFYSTQTTKKPGSIYATYLLDGIPKPVRESSVNEHQHGGEDVRMQSSPYMSSSMSHHEDQEDAIPSRSIVLASEEDLEGKRDMRVIGFQSTLYCPLLTNISAAKANFRQIYSIHIYSLGPSRVQVSR